MSLDAAYPPLNVPKELAAGLWIVDAAPIKAQGILTIPLRMTVLRLRDGDLLLFSPTRFDETLRDKLETFGPIRHLVAPSVGHWMFLREWQRRCPDAKTWGVRALAQRRAVKEAGIRFDAILGSDAPPAWGEDVEQVLFEAPGYAEVNLFHKPSRSLIVADTVLDVEAPRLPPVSRLMARLAGICRPHGMAPAQLRLLLRLNRAENAAAATRAIGFKPARVVVAHGTIIENDAVSHLRRSFAWLTGARRGLDGKVVVVTGASSGIGRAAARAFARSGARLVLAARREHPLQEVAGECGRLGVEVLVVPTDVTDAEAVAELARRAENAFGRVDVWLNNAGTGVFGTFAEADLALHRKTVEVNLIGAMNGAAAILPVFLKQGHGTLINNISLGGWAPTPFAAAYTATKFGLRGLTASLRQELAPHKDIHVCGVFPSMVDTPGFVHGANMSGRHLDPGPFLYTADDVAETFVRVAEHPRDETAVGWPARVGQAAYAVLPGPTEHVMGAVFRWLLARAKPAPRTKGALLETLPEGVNTSGGWLQRKKLPPAGTITLGLVAIGIAGLTAAAVVYAKPSAGTSASRRRRR